MAHEKGLIHRDVKPSNVILTAEDHVYLTDFGLAKRAETAAGLTRADQMLGTVDYVAPEQIEGSEPDARGDVYSLGCVLFEMLMGEAPFADQVGGMAKMWAQVNADPPRCANGGPTCRCHSRTSCVGRWPIAGRRPTAAGFRAGVLAAVGEEP